MTIELSAMTPEQLAAARARLFDDVLGNATGNITLAHVLAHAGKEILIELEEARRELETLRKATPGKKGMSLDAIRDQIVGA